jgi:short-subunit dehydrogenase
MARDLNGKVAVVTGASKGTGAAGITPPRPRRVALKLVNAP